MPMQNTLVYARTSITAPFYALFCILQLQHMTVDNCRIYDFSETKINSLLQHMTVDNCRIEGYSALYPVFLCVKMLVAEKLVCRYGPSGVTVQD